MTTKTVLLERLKVSMETCKEELEPFQECNILAQLLCRSMALNGLDDRCINGMVQVEHAWKYLHIAEGERPKED